MTARFAGATCRLRVMAFVSLAAICGTLVSGADTRVKYLGLADAKETLNLFADSGIEGSNITDPGEWDHWIRDQDTQVRGRIDGGVEDSISNFILYGASYTQLPRFENPESAVDQNGHISEAAQARV